MNKSNNSVLSLAVISMVTWITCTFNKLPVYLTTHIYDIKVNCFWRGDFLVNVWKNCCQATLILSHEIYTGFLYKSHFLYFYTDH